jgi:hypothetical protein
MKENDVKKEKKNILYIEGDLITGSLAGRGDRLSDSKNFYVGIKLVINEVLSRCPVESTVYVHKKGVLAGDVVVECVHGPRSTRFVPDHSELTLLNWASNVARIFLFEFIED